MLIVLQHLHHIVVVLILVVVYTDGWLLEFYTLATSKLISG